MTEKRPPLGGKIYQAAWTEACNQMRRIPQPGTNWTYSFAEAEAKQAFDYAWVSSDITVMACIHAAHNVLTVAAQNRFAQNERTRLKQEQANG